MRKIIAGFAISLDGFMEGPNGEYDWIVNDPEHFKELAKAWENTDAFFYGRKTYEMSMAMSKKSGKNKKQNNPFAHMKHYIFSNTLKSVGEDFILVGGDVKTEVTKIKNQPGKDIMVFGGAQLAGSLMNMGLIDEVGVGICPVLLGSGKPFFQGIDKKIDLTLSDSKVYASGLVALTYRVKQKNKK
jgi:dihydrofolate reductase